MAADDRPDAAFQKQQVVVLFRQQLLLTRRVLGAVGVADDHATARLLIGHALRAVLGQLPDALLAPTRHARQRKLALDADAEQRLHIELRARVGNGAGDAAAAAQ